MDELTWTLLQMGVVVHIALDYTDHALPNRVVERIGGYTCMTTSINTASSIPMGLKRLTDIMAGLVGCAITGVAFIFVAPLIYKASPGPFSIARSVSARMAAVSKCINSVPCIWMQRNAKKN